MPVVAFLLGAMQLAAQAAGPVAVMGEHNGMAQMGLSSQSTKAGNKNENAADTTDPRAAAYELALANARALKKVGAYDLASIEYDRAMRLNKNNIPEIQQEKMELRQAQDGSEAPVVEVEPTPLPGSPQWLYDSVVALATRQFAEKRFDSALVHYRMAGQMLPEQTFPGSQIKAIEFELAQIWKKHASARVELLSREARAALAQKNYTAALPRLYELLHYNTRDEEWVRTQFTNVERLLANRDLDTDSMLTKVKLMDVWDVIEQNRPDPPMLVAASASSQTTGTSQPRGVPAAMARTKPVAAMSEQTEVLPYTAAQLAEMYPEIDFTRMPTGQVFNILDDEEAHEAAIGQAAKKKSTLQLSDSTGNIKVAVEGIYFSKMDTYLKVRVTNNSVSDFPVGPMMLSWKQRGLRLVDRIPVALSGHPIVQPGKYFYLYYACRNMYMRDNEELYFSVQGRLGFPTWRIRIPGKLYNQERNKSINYF